MHEERLLISHPARVELNRLASDCIKDVALYEDHVQYYICGQSEQSRYPLSMRDYRPEVVKAGHEAAGPSVVLAWKRRPQVLRLAVQPFLISGNADVQIWAWQINERWKEYAEDYEIRLLPTDVLQPTILFTAWRHYQACATISDKDDSLFFRQLGSTPDYSACVVCVTLTDADNRFARSVIARDPGFWALGRTTGRTTYSVGSDFITSQSKPDTESLPLPATQNACPQSSLPLPSRKDSQ